MRTPILVLILSLVACGGAQKGGAYTPSAGADVRCYEGNRSLGSSSYQMVLKVVFDQAANKFVETYTDRSHSQNNYAPYDGTSVYAVNADGTGTSKGGATIKFTAGDAFKWTSWTTHSESNSASVQSVTDRTATLEGDKLTYAELNKTKLGGIDTTNPSTDTFTQFDCAQYDAKRQALPAGGK